jgi:hypothetical protein
MPMRTTGLLLLAMVLVPGLAFAQPAPPPVAPSDDQPPPVVTEDTPAPIVVPQPQRVQAQTRPSNEAEAQVHALPPGKALALALEQTGRFDAAGKQWLLLGKSATGELGKALTRRVNALAEAELGLAALAAGKTADAVKKLRSACVEVLAEAPQDLPMTGALAQALAFAEHVAGHAREVQAALQQVAAHGSPAQIQRAQRLAGAAWPKIERILGEPDDEQPVGVAALPGGGFAIAADAQVPGAGHKLRLWTVDAAGRQQRLVTWGGGGDDEPLALATTAKGRMYVAGRTTSHGGHKAWLMAFEGTKPALESVLPADEARAVVVLADGVALAGTYDQRAWLGIVKDGVLDSAVAFGPKGCQGTGVAALPGGKFAVVAHCGAKAVVTSVEPNGPPRWSVEVPSAGPCNAFAAGKQLVVTCPDRAVRLDAATGRKLAEQAWPKARTPELEVFAAALDGKRLGLLRQAEGTLSVLAAKGAGVAGPVLPGFRQERMVAFLRAGPDLVLISGFAGDVLWRRIPLR